VEKEGGGKGEDSFLSSFLPFVEEAQVSSFLCWFSVLGKLKWRVNYKIGFGSGLAFPSIGAFGSH
jgi:hypothetical protein